MAKLNHFGITVNSIERSIKFYSDVLGLDRPDAIVDNEGHWIEAVTSTRGTLLRTAFLHTDTAMFELLEYARPDDGAPENRLRNNDVGAAHLALTTENIFEDVNRLREAGVVVDSEPQRVESGPWTGATIVYLRDPDGNAVELVQPVE